MIPDIDPNAVLPKRRLMSSLEPELTKIRAHRAHLFGRIRPPGDTLPDERWDVNLEEPSFTITWGRDVVTRCEAQLAGTWSRRDETFLWGHHNPSVAGAGTRHLATWLEQPDLAPLARFKRFSIDEEEVMDLAGAVAARFGWLGPYPGATADVIALLLVKPLPEPATGRLTPWCTFCGKHRVGRLIAASPCALCDGSNCLGLFADVVDEMEGDSKESAPAGLGCAFCFREDVTVIQHRYAGMCLECIQLARDIVRDDPPG